MNVKMNSVKGKHFEARVERRLNANFPECEILHDVSISGRKGNPTQIDFVLLDETGVYVIEAKCYSGVVRGKEEDVWWEKTSIDKDGNKWTKLAMNPIKQNAGHVKYIKKIITDDSIPVFSVSVVSEKCDFSSIRVNKHDTFLFHLKEFTTGIRGIMETSEVSISSENIERIKNTLISQETII